MLLGAGYAVPGRTAAEGVNQCVVSDDLARVQDELAARRIQFGHTGLHVCDAASAQQLADRRPALGVVGCGLMLADPVQEPGLRGDEGHRVAPARAGGRGQTCVPRADDHGALCGHVMLPFHAVSGVFRKGTGWAAGM